MNTKREPLRVVVRTSSKTESIKRALLDEHTYIGAHPESTLCFLFAGLRNRHAVLTKTPFDLILQKCSPYSDVLLNGQRMLSMETPIVTGDVVKIGEVYIDFEDVERRLGFDAKLPHQDHWAQVVQKAGQHLAPHTERVQDALVTRLEYAVGGTHQATLTYKRSRRGGVIEFTASVPLRNEPEVPAVLQKQKRFLVGFFQTVGELEIDNKEIDDAFFIDAAKDDADLLRAVAKPLLAFIGLDIHLTIARETIVMNVAGCDEAILEPLFSLWCTICDFRSGAALMPA